MFELTLVFLAIAAIGGVCYWRRATPQDRAIHKLITEPHNKSAAISLTNLPQGSRLGAHAGKAAAVLEDGSVLAESAGGTRTFASLAAYRDFIGDGKALSFADQAA